MRANILTSYELLGSCDRVGSLLQQLSLRLRYLVLLYTTLWYRASIVTLSIPATTQEAVTVQVLSHRQVETQSTTYVGMSGARSLALSVEALTLSKPPLISMKRVETFGLGLWSVLLSWMRVRHTSEELRPARGPN